MQNFYATMQLIVSLTRDKFIVEEFIFNIVDLVLSNSENITLGVIIFVFIILVAAMVFSFVHLALKLANRNSEDRSQERAADNTVIDRLFVLVDKLSALDRVIENLSQLIQNSNQAYAIQSEFNKQFIDTLQILNQSIQKQHSENVALRTVKALESVKPDGGQD